MDRFVIEIKDDNRLKIVEQPLKWYSSPAATNTIYYGSIRIISSAYPEIVINSSKHRGVFYIRGTQNSKNDREIRTTPENILLCLAVSEAACKAHDVELVIINKGVTIYDS